MVLDPRSDRPLYQQLADTLRAMIESGEYRPDQKLPSEWHLAAGYGVSRNTARDALQVLIQEGLIEVRPRKGYFVRGVSEEVAVYVERDAKIRSRMPSSRERQEMGIPEGVPLLVVRREGQSDELHRGDQAVLEFEA